MGTDPFAFLLGKESKEFAISSATQLVNARLDRNVHVFELTVGWWCLSDSVAWDRRRETSGCPSLWLQRRKDWHLRVLHLIPKPWHFKTRQNDGHPLLIEPNMLRIFQRRSLHPYCSTVTFPSLLVWYQTLSNLNISNWLYHMWSSMPLDRISLPWRSQPTKDATRLSEHPQ